ncbi:MAG: LUD domain-containing protein [Bacteroidales bacterium]|jgi:L-lactate dehydrogenase complex protein LldG|nr:LUD domain-containing protein [Bacteroidales bacterium]MDD4087054.1 LUD domain-containing protein [Bacteroidales bacterium]MDY0085540.1 LUD domain-containing protein [Bacteroidales bacterium]
MKESTPREQILTKIRNALIEKTSLPYPDVDISSSVLKPIDEKEGLEVAFAKALIQAGGQFVYCENEHQFLGYLQTLMQERGWDTIWTQSNKVKQVLKAGELSFAEVPGKDSKQLVGLTDCERLIAQNGSIVLSDQKSGSRMAIAFPEVQLVMGYASQVVSTLKTALQDIRQFYPDTLPSQLVFITGPSRTADIEKTLVMGAHGPKELILFLIDDI